MNVSENRCYVFSLLISLGSVFIWLLNNNNMVTKRKLPATVTLREKFDIINAVKSGSKKIHSSSGQMASKHFMDTN